jgi:hypothetical protein
MQRGRVGSADTITKGTGRADLQKKQSNLESYRSHDVNTANR